MPQMLHDPAVRDSIVARVRALTPNATRAWGKMSVDQMLWHVNETMEAALGRRTLAPMKIPLPNAILKFAVLNLPWGRGVRTHPAWIAGDHYDFEAEKGRCLALIDEFTRRSVDSAWPPSAAFGKASGREWSQLHAKHLRHHLAQFNV
jgi:hypothetical protein